MHLLMMKLNIENTLVNGENYQFDCLFLRILKLHIYVSAHTPLRGNKRHPLPMVKLINLIVLILSVCTHHYLHYFLSISFRKHKYTSSNLLYPPFTHSFHFLTWFEFRNCVQRCVWPLIGWENPGNKLWLYLLLFTELLRSSIQIFYVLMQNYSVLCLSVCFHHFFPS